VAASILSRNSCRWILTNILFICGGAFAGLDKIIAQRGRGTTIGFGADVKDVDARGIGDLFKELEPEDLLRYGLIPEFVGRLPVIATLEDLDEAALITILTEPKNAFVKQYKKLFSLEGVELTFTDGALKAVAARAIERKTGARGLRSILENLLLNTMYEIPDMEGVQEVIVSEETVKNNKAPEYVYEDKKKAAKPGKAKSKEESEVIAK
jgi:ATP-dependent Clp protease ATP-binding subunit ClpX